MMFTVTSGVLVNICIDVLHGKCITLSRDKSLLSDHEIRFGSI